MRPTQLRKKRQSCAKNGPKRATQRVELLKQAPNPLSVARTIQKSVPHPRIQRTEGALSDSAPPASRSHKLPPPVLQVPTRQLSQDSLRTNKIRRLIRRPQLPRPHDSATQQPIGAPQLRKSNGFCNFRSWNPLEPILGLNRAELGGEGLFG